MHVALKAFHCPLRLRSIDNPPVGWLKYAEDFPARAATPVTKT